MRRNGGGVAERYDLLERMTAFAVNVAKLTRRLPWNVSNNEHIRQVVRSSGSIAANYIEADEAVSTKERVYRLRVCRKEAKESSLWLHLLVELNPDEHRGDLVALHDESQQLRRILSAIIAKLDLSNTA